MFDWFVLLTPLLFLPIFLLFVFVGCQVITGVDEYEPAPEMPPPAPRLTFVIEAGMLDANVEKIRWGFPEIAQTLEYPPGGGLPANFDTGPFERGWAGSAPLLNTEDPVDHGLIGEPDDGVVIFTCRGWRPGDPDDEPSLQDTFQKGPGDIGFPEFRLSPTGFTLS